MFRRAHSNACNEQRWHGQFRFLLPYLISQRLHSGACRGKLHSQHHAAGLLSPIVQDLLPVLWRTLPSPIQQCAYGAIGFRFWSLRLKGRGLLVGSWEKKIDYSEHNDKNKKRATFPGSSFFHSSRSVSLILYHVGVYNHFPLRNWKY